MNILCIGDIVGKPGRDAVKGLIKDLRKEYQVDFVIANAENVAGGSGITSKLAKDLLANGCDVLTLGDHVWDQKELEGFLNQTDQVLRPANFPDGAPGKGWCIRTLPDGKKIGVVCLLGRVFMRYQVECPFLKLKEIVNEIRKQTPIIVLDFHAEATSEKIALGYYIDGEISALFGTHTHVQTADERLLPKQTAFITDLGMTGPINSIIGQDKENIIQRFLTSRPIKFYVAKNDVQLNGIVLKIDPADGKAQSIERIQRSFAWADSTVEDLVEKEA